MRFIAIIILSTISNLTFGAGSVPSEQTGKIKSIQALNDGRVIVFMIDTRPEKPDCASYPYWLISDENSTGINGVRAQLFLIFVSVDIGFGFI